MKTFEEKMENGIQEFVVDSGYYRYSEQVDSWIQGARWAEAEMQAEMQAEIDRLHEIINATRECILDITRGYR